MRMCRHELKGLFNGALNGLLNRLQINYDGLRTNGESVTIIWTGESVTIMMTSGTVTGM